MIVKEILNVVNNLLQFFINLGNIGIFLALVIEIIPSEIILSYGGFLISSGKSTYLSCFLAGILGGTIAQIFLYILGRYGGIRVVRKYGKYIFIDEHHLNLAEKWFKKYGIGMIFFARFIPIVRHAISIPAGISKMSLKTFTIYTILATIPWTMFFLYLGMQLKENWLNIKEYSSKYIIYIILFSIICLFMHFIYKIVKTKKSNKNN